ncbi:MAG: RdgB/HAM1 family non-canonical purine NTP pyrophosphatase [Gammaproteobacteria bacterium]
MSFTIILASGNKGKLSEFSEIFAPININIKPQSDWNVSSVEETGLTFIENALIKARHASIETGLPALSDDSGLVVDALGGQPGIYSSRFAGEHADEKAYTAKLLEVMKDVPMAERTARFVCVLAFLQNPQDPMPIIAQATWEGTILTERRGSGGFGYDPVFFVKEENCSAAELDSNRKHALSHRGRATHLMLKELKKYLHDHPV